MEREGIGIDCSGLVAHLYDKWLKSFGLGGIRRNLKWPKLDIYRNLITHIRPIENISAELLTSEINSVKVEIKDVRPGDLIRLKGAKQGDHVVMISKVNLNNDANPVRIEYVHSSPHYASNNGVKRGEIIITDIAKGLDSQDWKEIDETGECTTKLGYLREIEDNGLVRPKFMQKMKWEK